MRTLTEPDADAQVVSIYNRGMAAAGESAADEVANATDLSGVTGVPFRAIGVM